MQQLESFILIKNKFSRIISSITSIINDLSSDKLTKRDYEENITLFKKNFDKDKFTIAVIGVIKRGKSTLLNALLETEEDILSRDVTPETARLTYLLYSENPKAIIHKKNGTKETINIDDIKKYTSSYDKNNSKGIKELVEETAYAEIYYPNEYLKNGVTIVDTPGIDDTVIERSDITHLFVAKADAVIFMLDAINGGLKDNELKYLQQKIYNNKGDKKGIIIVFNKVKLLRKHQIKELPKLLQKAKLEIQKVTGKEFDAIPLDSLMAIEGIREENKVKFEESGFQAFKTYLEEYLVQEKGKIILRTKMNEFLYKILLPVKEYLNYELNLTPHNLEIKKKELEQAEANIIKIRNNANITLKELEERRANLDYKISREVKDEFNKLNSYINDDKAEYIPREINYRIDRLNGSLEELVRMNLKAIIKILEADKIKLPYLNFEIYSPDIDINDFFETVEDNRTLWKGVVNFFYDLFGSDSKYTENILNRSELRDTIDSIMYDTISSFKSEKDYYFNMLKDEIQNWFKIENTKNENSRNSILQSKKRTEDEHNKHINNIKILFNKVKNLESELNEQLIELERL